VADQVIRHCFLGAFMNSEEMFQNPKDVILNERSE
jgi:hypothetical protein